MPSTCIKRLGAYVNVISFETIVDEQVTRHIRQQLPAYCFAIDATLQFGERQWLPIAPCKQVTVEHGAIRQPLGGRFDFGKAAGQQLFAATPQKSASATPHQLRANTVPLPLGLPLVHRPE